MMFNVLEKKEIIVNNKEQCIYVINIDEIIYLRYLRQDYINIISVIKKENIEKKFLINPYVIIGNSYYILDKIENVNVYNYLLASENIDILTKILETI